MAEPESSGSSEENKSSVRAVSAPAPRPDAVEQKAARERRRAWLSWFKRAVALLFVAAAVAAVVIAWLPKPLPVDLEEIALAELQVTIDEDGRTRVKDRYQVSAPLMANVGRIELEPGDAIEPGDVLARLVPIEAPLLDTRTRAQAQARVAAASAARRQAHASIGRVRTALEFAEREADRQGKLTGSGATSARAVEQAQLALRTRREELASAEFGAKVADYEVQMARAALGRMGKGGKGGDEQLEVSAPVAGRVLKVFRQSEGVVQPGTPLVEVGDPAALEIVVDVLTSDAVSIEPGTTVRIERWGGERPLRAHVRLVEPSAFTRISALGVEEQRVNVVVDLDEPHTTWQALGDGYRVESRIVVWQGDDILTAPASAVFRRGDGHAVYRHEGGLAKLVPVRVGRRNAHRVQILEGLEVGDRVIAHPSDRVADGVEVVQR
ncbi:MAG: HlyD family efflux transporter periplasmic adaptor subunit [Myxococcales bacterium]|nr:HlyD family efflux transporter periplasmic adaptor subunit [Myxococcales bacterium]